MLLDSLKRLTLIKKNIVMGLMVLLLPLFALADFDYDLSGEKCENKCKRGEVCAGDVDLSIHDKKAMSCKKISELTCSKENPCPGKDKYECKTKITDDPESGNHCVEVAKVDDTEIKACEGRPTNISVTENCNEQESLLKGGCELVGTVGSESYEKDSQPAGKNCQFKLKGCYKPDLGKSCDKGEKEIVLQSGITICKKTPESMKETAEADKEHSFENPVNCSYTRGKMDEGGCLSKTGPIDITPVGSEIGCTFLSLNCYTSDNCPADKKVGEYICLR